MNHTVLAAAAAGAVLLLGLPVGAAILVSLASRREDSAHSLSRHPAGRVQRAARRLLAMPAGGVYRPASKAESQVRFAHARRALPDSRQFPPRRQPPQGAVSPDRRQRAGV